MKQETDYPNSGAIKIEVNPSTPTEFTLYLRAPRWSKGAECTINGESATPQTPEPGLLAIRREWKADDRVDLNFPMEFRLIKGRKAQDGRVAVARGPMLFTCNPKRNPDMANIDPRLMVLDPGSIEGPFPDDSVRPGGMACRAKVWMPGAWYPSEGTKELVLTEFADPGAVATYFLIPNPNDARAVADELVGAGKDVNSI